MGIHAKHILISCHEEDTHDMRILLQGMAVHSDFIHWHLNDFFEEAIDLLHAGIGMPRLPMWHGFTVPGFPFEVMASLIASVNWKHEGMIEIRLEVDGRMETYAAREFFHAVREGKIK